MGKLGLFHPYGFKQQPYILTGRGPTSYCIVFFPLRMRESTILPDVQLGVHDEKRPALSKLPISRLEQHKKQLCCL